MGERKQPTDAPSGAKPRPPLAPPRGALISTEAEEIIRALYDEGRLGEAQRLVLEEIEKSLGHRGETMLPTRGKMLKRTPDGQLQAPFSSLPSPLTAEQEKRLAEGLLVKIGGEGTPDAEPPFVYLREEKLPGGDLVRVGVRIGPKRQEILGMPVVLDEAMDPDLVKIGDRTFRLGDSEDTP